MSLDVRLHVSARIGGDLAVEAGVDAFEGLDGIGHQVRVPDIDDPYSEGCELVATLLCIEIREAGQVRIVLTLLSDRIQVHLAQAIARQARDQARERGQGFERVAVQLDDAGIRIDFEKPAQVEQVRRIFQHPGPGRLVPLQVLQLCLVQLISAGARGRPDVLIELPGHEPFDALADQGIVEQLATFLGRVRLGLVFDAHFRLRISIEPRYAPCRGEPAWADIPRPARKGIRDFPEQRRPMPRILRQQAMQERRSGAR